MSNIAIVTGASSGLGREICRQIDAGEFGPIDEIWAIARRSERLDALARISNVKVRPFALNLLDPVTFDIIENCLAETPHTHVKLLVNCAGVMRFGKFSAIEPADTRQMMSLLCLAPIELTYRALPFMRAGSRILNVSSVAAFMPMPELAIYSACKRFILDWSQSLNAELASVDIHTCALCPKFMHTELLDNVGSRRALNDTTFIGFESVETVVKKAADALRTGKAICIPSPEMKAYYVLAKVLPYPLALRLKDALRDFAAEYPAAFEWLNH